MRCGSILLYLSIHPFLPPSLPPLLTIKRHHCQNLRVLVAMSVEGDGWAVGELGDEAEGGRGGGREGGREGGVSGRRRMNQ
jgi:hypothetical protein